MRVYFNISNQAISNFDYNCAAVLRNVGSGTKKGTEAACKEILAASLAQVPKDTRTLASSAFYEVSRRADIAQSSYRYEAIVGYGGNGNPVNPRSGLRASDYAVDVHEDLGMPHRNGKAKFLEDPIRQYAATNFTRTMFSSVQESLAGSYRV